MIVCGIGGFKFIGEVSGDYVGIVVVLVGDIDGDGFDDFFVGVSLNDVGGVDVGVVYVIYGGFLLLNDGDYVYIVGDLDGDIVGL